MSKIYRSLLLLFFVFTSVIAIAQTKEVTGKVTDTEGAPIAGATIRVVGGRAGTATDANGNFKFTILNNIEQLTINAVGYIQQTVALTGSPLTVTLTRGGEDVAAGDEVVVVGYGTQRKMDVTSSISKVSGGEISNLSTPSFDNQLSGRAAGVQVIQPSGVLGATPTFRIRGISSLTGGTQPLFVIDGVPMTSGDISQGYVAINAMSDINPDDIESIDILKDGAATAVYGSRAANGVVLITTIQTFRKSRECLVSQISTMNISLAKVQKLCFHCYTKELI